jgi:hypothetical protein
VINLDFKDVLSEVVNNNILDCTYEENLSMFSIIITSNCPPKIDLSFFTKINELICSRDSIYSLSLILDENEPITYESNEDDFIEQINSDINYIGNIKRLTLNVKIIKATVDSTITIYNLDAFTNYLYALNLSELINSLYFVSKNDYLHFEIKNTDSNFVSYSNRFCFKAYGSLFEKNFDNYTDNVKKRKSICNFGNDESFDFEPSNFDFSCQISEKIDILFTKLKIIYSLIYIFNVSRIKEDFLFLQITGYKSSSFTVDFNSININNTIHYYDIYKWIYMNGSIGDRIDIARNIISVYLINSPGIGINNTALDAIKSNYNIYLTENVEKYLELKSKLVESLFSINKLINDISDSITSGFIKNIGAIGAFVISAIITNSFSEKRLSNIFTRDISIISLGLIGVSSLYLAYTLKDVKSKVKNLIITYYRLKTSYNGILVRKDINNIFNKDRYLKKDIKNIKSKIKFYVKLWILVLIIFLFVVLYLGPFDLLNQIRLIWRTFYS